MVIIQFLLAKILAGPMAAPDSHFTKRSVGIRRFPNLMARIESGVFVCIAEKKE